jgi:hypothetical protein
VSWKLALSELLLLVFPRPRPRAAAAGHKYGTVSLPLYAPLEPATGLWHRRFGHRLAVVMLAGGTATLYLR